MADWVTEETRNKLYSDIVGLKPWIVRDLKRLNILRPTPVQYACIPPALQGKNVLGGAKTGSGKTLAFVLPILNKLSSEPYGIFSLVLTPTRELAFQIADQFRAVGASMGVRVSVVVGGMDRIQQCRELEQEPHILVATPGRLYDILSYQKEFTLRKIKFLVIDEADRLLGGKFSEQLSVIMAQLPPKFQTLMFSATITEDISTMLEFAKGEVFTWESTKAATEGGGCQESTVAQLKELYCLVNPKVRDAALVAYLLQWRELNAQQQAIVFVDTCVTAEALGLTLQELGIPCVTYHSNKSQVERLHAVNQLKSSNSRLMIATSLADRGLDIPLVSLVVNHRLPNDYRTYLHRVGRTARAGRAGTALSIITPEDQNLLQALEARNPQKLKEYECDHKLVRRIMKQVMVTKREQEIKLEDSGFSERKIINKRKELILQGLDPDEECAKLQERIRMGQQKRRRQFLKEHGGQLNGCGDGLSSKDLEKKILLGKSDKIKQKLSSTIKITGGVSNAKVGGSSKIIKNTGRVNKVKLSSSKTGKSHQKSENKVKH